jgi:hypothetical protein
MKSMSEEIKEREDKIIEEVMKEIDNDIFKKIPEEIKDLQSNLDFSFSYKGIDFQLIPENQIKNWREVSRQAIEKALSKQKQEAQKLFKDAVEKLLEKYHKPLGVFEVENLKQELLKVLGEK